MELQEELIKAGFKVPKPTQIPIIYSNCGGWVEEKKPLNVELIDPSQYGKTPEELGWLKRENGYSLPTEESYLEVSYQKKEGIVMLNIDVKKFHLERVSRRGVNPEKWKNWVAIYLDLKDIHDLAKKLTNVVGVQNFEKKFYIKREVLPGEETTYFIYRDKKFEKFGLPIVEGFSFCLGCFDHVLEYFKYHAKGIRIPVEKLRLRIEKDPAIPSFLKVGVAKVKGKHAQFMIKLSSSEEKSIEGVLKSEVTGKKRGRIVRCDHVDKIHWISIDAKEFTRAVSFWSHILVNRDLTIALNKKISKPSFFEW